MVTTRRKQAKFGDVLQIDTPKGFAYVHYIGRHPHYGAAVVVYPEVGQRPDMPAGQAPARTYVTFYPAATAVAQGFAEIVGHATPPEMPRRFRRPGGRAGKRILTWIIEDGDKEVVKPTLSGEDLRLPIASIWNHAFLIHSIVTGWDPLNVGRGDGGEEAGATPVESGSDLVAAPEAGSPRSIRHYLYAPNRKAASLLSEELNRHGFSTEQRPSAAGSNWLVLARRADDPSDSSVALTRELMEEAASRYGGEYDGWEAEIGSASNRFSGR